MSTDDLDGGTGPLSFGEVRDAMMPPGADKDALWAALKQAHRTGGYVPGSRAPDISIGASQVPDMMKRALPSGSMPEDPFTPSDGADIAVSSFYFGMLRCNVPLASVENIIAGWLARIPGDRPVIDPIREDLLMRVGDLWRGDWSGHSFDGRDGAGWIDRALHGDAEDLRSLSDELKRLEGE